MKKFSIIIINYKQKKYLFDCVDSLVRNLIPEDCEIIIVNNSPEEDISVLTQSYDFVKIIDNENKGFSNANNLAVKYSSGEYLLFLNPDTIINDNILENFLKHFSNKIFGAVGLKLLFPDNIFQISFGLKNNLINEVKNKYYEKKFCKRDLKIINKVESIYSDIKKVDWVSCAAMIVRKNVFQQICGFDERYFLYYEDADICERLNKAGYENYFFPFSSVIHFKGENTNKKFYENIYYHSKESQLIYYSSHNKFVQNLLLRFYLLIRFSVKYLLSFRKYNLKVISIVFKKTEKIERC